MSWRLKKTYCLLNSSGKQSANDIVKYSEGNYNNERKYTVKKTWKGSKNCFKRYLRRRRKLLKAKRYNRNHIKNINTWAVPVVRYSGPFLKCIREELKQMDQRTRNLLTMHKALHLRDDTDWLYVSRKEGERGVGNIHDSVDTSIRRLEDYNKKSK